MSLSGENTKEKLILAAIAEIQEHGITDFSVRRAAERCAMSSGAPYKHFSGKNDLILKVLQYINEKWYERQQVVLQQAAGDVRAQLIEISMAYIVFLCDNPEFQSILMLNDHSMATEQLKEKARVSELSGKLIHEYCLQVNMNAADEKRKTYVVRSFIYGAALLINSGNMSYNQETLNIARQCISREFDLP